MEKETSVIIVGAGPAGLATSACLNMHNISNIVLEREDCHASLWRKRAYDRLKLHLAKEFCHLPYLPFPSDAPTYVPRQGFILYLDDYAAKMDVRPLYRRSVVSASFDPKVGKWVVVAENGESGMTEIRVARFLVVATGENSDGYVSPIRGMDSFEGDIMHSCLYDNGKRFDNAEVLVVGSGNSGMEIALDLANSGAHTSIVVRSPVHIVDESMVRFGMVLLQYLRMNIVDNLVLTWSTWKYGNLSGYGLKRPTKGPFFLKKETGRSPVLDVGTIAKIKAGLIQVFPSIKKVEGEKVYFENGETKSFDAIVFATGYTSTVLKWLKDDGGMFGENGMPKRSAPNHWKGENGLYCAGFSRSGLFGISNDAKAIAQHVQSTLNNN